MIKPIQVDRETWLNLAFINLCEMRGLNPKMVVGDLETLLIKELEINLAQVEITAALVNAHRILAYGKEETP